MRPVSRPLPSPFLLCRLFAFSGSPAGQRREGHRDARFPAAPTPAFCPSGASPIPLKKNKNKNRKSVTWCLMNCKLALQMEIFIFQFIWKRSGLRLLASFGFIYCV